MKRSIKNHPLLCEEDAPKRYYSLQNKKTGNLFTTLTGKVLVTTHKLVPEDKEYRCVELVIKGK